MNCKIGLAGLKISPSVKWISQERQANGKLCAGMRASGTDCRVYFDLVPAREG